MFLNLRDKRGISNTGLCMVKAHEMATDGASSFGPILSALDTLCLLSYKFSKFLLPILGLLTTNEHTIKDFFILAEELQSFDSKLVMSSFDT